jgi:hypothetical protein
MFLGLPYPVPAIIMQKSKKNFYTTVLSLLYDFLSLKTDVNVPSKSKKATVLEQYKTFLLNCKNSELKHCLKPTDGPLTF